VVVSISLVLFMLGMVAMIMLQANELSRYVKENIRISIYLKDGLEQVDVKRFQKSLDASAYVKTTQYIDPETAAATLQEDLGEDFIAFLGENPLEASIDVYLAASHAHPDSVAWIESDLMANPKVKEIYYQKSLLNAVNENVKRISILISGFAFLLLIVAVALINNTIRLAIFSKRFIIRSMQLGGATRAFIRRPFAFKALAHGFYGALIAMVLLAGLLYYGQTNFPEVFEGFGIDMFIVLFGLVIVLGMLISYVSTSLAVSRYLRMKTDKLY
jgi:cell division transport system permease protein